MRGSRAAKGVPYRGACALVCGLALLIGGSAQAQSASSVPQAAGIKIGEGRLHPFLDADAVYDSLIGYFSTSGGNLQPSGDLIIHARPGLKFDLTTPSTMIAFNGSAEYLWYTGVISRLGSVASGQLSRFQANVGLDAQFNKDGAVEVQLGDTLLRTDRTQNPAVTVGVLSLYNDVRLAVPIHPGGRALEFIPKASWQIELFDPVLVGTVPWCASTTDPLCNPNSVRDMNYSNLNFGLNARWKFLPKTAVMVDASFDWRTYLNNTTVNQSATLFKVQAGLVGLISPRISVTLLAGYSGEFTGAVNNFIANAEFAYIPSDQARLSVGYLRTMQPVPVYGTFGDDRGYLTGRLGLLGGRLAFAGTVSADYFTFYGPPTARSTRRDFLLAASVGPSFDVTSWFAVAAAYSLGFRTLPASTTAGSPSSMLRHEVMLRLTVHY